jgi:hypothetical protein
MDEGSLSPYQAYVNIQKRLRQRDASGQPYPFELFITSSPRQLNWLYHEITKNEATIKMYNAGTFDNTFLTQRKRHEIAYYHPSP